MLIARFTRWVGRINLLSNMDEVGRLHPSHLISPLLSREKIAPFCLRDKWHDVQVLLERKRGRLPAAQVHMRRDYLSLRTHTHARLPQIPSERVCRADIAKEEALFLGRSYTELIKIYD